MKTLAIRIRASCSILRRAAPIALVTIAIQSSGRAAVFSWDPGQTGSANVGGTGNWNTSSTFWFNGSSDVLWTAGNDAALGGTAGTVTVKSGVSVDDLIFNTSGYTITSSTLTLTGGSVNVPAGGATISSVIGGTSNITKLGTGNLTLSSALNLGASASLNIAGGNLILGQPSATFNQSNGGTLNGNLVIASSIRVNFNSPLTASTPSTYNGSGSIQLQSPFSVISNTSGSYGGAIGAGIELNSLNLPFTKTDVTQTNLAYPASNSFVTAIGATKNGTSNWNLIINGAISGNSDVVLASNSATAGGGAGIMQLNAQNTYTGTTFLDGNGPDVGSGGSVILGVSNALPVSTDLVFGFLTPSPSHSPKLDLNGNNQQIGSLSMSSTADLPANQGSFSITNDSNGVSISTLTVSGNTTPANPFGGSIDDGPNGGKIALVKSGPSALVLSGSSTYSGGTTLDGGLLVVANGSGSATGLGAVTLNGGTLASGPNGGSISGDVIAGSGPHTIAPGGAGTIGTLALGGNLTLSANSTLDFDLSGNMADLLTITDSLSISGQANLDINASGTPSGTYTLATYGSSSSLNAGDFLVSGVPPGYALEVGSTQLLLAPVPEPPGLLLLLAATMALIVCKRCRDRRGHAESYGQRRPHPRRHADR
jgi:fibronectin-binding autotransporter adhesin